MKYLLLTLIVLSSFFGCGEKLMQYEIDTNTPVVECYLEEGSNLLTVKLYGLEIYSKDEYILSRPISGLELRVNEKTLSENPAGTYSLEVNDTIKERTEFHLQFDYMGKNITASAVIPQPITGLKIEPQSITQPSFYGTDSLPDIILSWDDPGNDFYQVYINSPNSSESQPPFNTGFGKRMMQPFQGNSYQLNARELFSVGYYSICIYRVNKDYVELYERISSSDLANPVSYINNAFGIFTGLSSSKTVLQVLADE